MKSDFSRFLHHTMSLSDLIRQSRWNKFATGFDPDTPIKSECDSLCTGRSMVEMLGVLAIIGVLSVGAIAGYSKAMTKYKLNKQSEQISWLINVMYRYKDMTNQIPAWGSFMPYLKKLGEIPQEMIKNDSNTIYDSFGIEYKIYANSCSPICRYINLSISMINDYKNFDICNNILETAKAFKEQLNNVNVWESGTSSELAIIGGDMRCEGKDKCLKNLTKTDIYDICQLCADKDGCTFNMEYKIKE